MLSMEKEENHCLCFKKISPYQSFVGVFLYKNESKAVR